VGEERGTNRSRIARRFFFLPGNDVLNGDFKGLVPIRGLKAARKVLLQVSVDGSEEGRRAGSSVRSERHTGKRADRYPCRGSSGSCRRRNTPSFTLSQPDPAENLARAGQRTKEECIGKLAKRPQRPHLPFVIVGAKPRPSICHGWAIISNFIAAGGSDAVMR